METNTVCCFTGHRRIPDGVLPRVMSSLRREVLRLVREEGFTRFLSGGAVGFDFGSILDKVRTKKGTDGSDDLGDHRDDQIES